MGERRSPHPGSQQVAGDGDGDRRVRLLNALDGSQVVDQFAQRTGVWDFGEHDDVELAGHRVGHLDARYLHRRGGYLPESLRLGVNQNVRFLHPRSPVSTLCTIHYI